MSMLDDPPPCPPSCGRDRHPREWCGHCYYERIPTIYLFDTWPRAERKRAIGTPGWERVQRWLREASERRPRPLFCEPWCNDPQGCCCDLEKRQREYDDRERAPDAVAQPRAVARYLAGDRNITNGISDFPIIQFRQPASRVMKYFLFVVAFLFGRA